MSDTKPKRKRRRKGKGAATDLRGVVSRGGAKAMAQARVGTTGLGVAVAGVAPLANIKPRPYNGLRPLDIVHVAKLAISIQLEGLAQGPAVDINGGIIAGDHRRAAMNIIAAPAKQRGAVMAKLVGQEVLDSARDNTWAEYLAMMDEGVGAFDPQRVPVRVFNFDSTKDVARALRIETAENEQRRNFTPAQVRNAWVRLDEAGYRTVPGKPRKGQVAAMPIMIARFSASERTIRRMIRQDEGGMDRRPVDRISEPTVRRRLVRDLLSYKFHHGDTTEVSAAIDTLVAALKRKG